MSEQTKTAPVAEVLMQPSFPVGKIYQILPKITSEIGFIPKAEKNQAQGYKYRGIDDVYKKLNELLAQHGVTIVPVCKEANFIHFTKGNSIVHKTSVVMGYDIYADDGSHIYCAIPGEAVDHSDKATAKAISMAYKYMAMELFCIPVEGEAGDNEKDNIIIPAEDKLKTNEFTFVVAKDKINKAPDQKALDGLVNQIAMAGFSDKENKELRALFSKKKNSFSKTEKPTK